MLSLLLAPGSEDWFTWTIAPDASARLLAVMYANAVDRSASSRCASRTGRARASLFVLITVFALAATTMTFFHLDPFLEHPAIHLVYWLGGYAVLVVTAPAVLIWQERAHGGRLPVELPMTWLQRATGAAAAAAMGGAALALLASPARFSDVWPWDVAPLTARLLGVWLGAFAIAYAWALWDGDWRRGAAALPDCAADRAAARARAARARRRRARVGRRGAGGLLRARPARRRAGARAAGAARRPAGARGGAGMTTRTVAPPVTRPMMPAVRAGLLAIAGVIFLLGLSLYVAPTETDRLFAWTIQVPLTAAFLGASYWASTRSPSPARSSATGPAGARSPRRT